MVDASAQPSAEVEVKDPGLEKGQLEEIKTVEPEEESVVLKDLLILPPLSKSSSATGATDEELVDAVPLPPIRAEEPVSSLRAALSEVCGYAQLTNYRLQLTKLSPEGATSLGEKRKELMAKETKGKTTEDTGVVVASPYTGMNAVISVPAVNPNPSALSSSEASGRPTVEEKKDGPTVLDDFGDLTTLVEDGLADGTAFRIVLERYDVAAVKDHVARLKSLLDGNAPTVTSFMEESTSSAEGESKTEEKDANNSNPEESPEESTEVSEDKKAEDKTSKEGEKPKEDAKKSLKLPKADPLKPVTVDGKNLKDFFYLACGEDSDLYHGDTKATVGKQQNGGPSPSRNKKKKNKKGNKSSDDNNKDNSDAEDESPMEEIMRNTIPRLNELEETSRVKCNIRYSGYHPPPSHRRLMGDLAYLEVSMEGEPTIFVTAMTTGFYVNKSTPSSFDPAPLPDKPCFSHEVLDCLLGISPTFTKLWSEAVKASKERAEFMQATNKDGPFVSLFRVAVRGDFDGYKNPVTASAYTGIDALSQTPSWLVPMPKPRSKEQSKDSDIDWKNYNSHPYSQSRAEEDLCSTFGVDVRSGAVRDWNEELQSAREMPTTTLPERIERARIIHKVLTDFGESAVVGVKAITDGHISAMNPNEQARSQVFLHNNIFFSRAVDAGVETFKMAKGDRAARKSASRDIQCIGTLHRMDTTELHTLATIVIDYLGTRFVCQSILPGILSGEKTHTLLYGAVEAGLKLKWNKEMHQALEKTLGEGLRVANRKVPRQPLTPERLEEIKKIKSSVPAYPNMPQPETADTEDDKDLGPTIDSCAPLEAKGIRGSDQRKYLLDISRLTPRDANWLPKEKGGTGMWEELPSKSGKAQESIPSSLDDDEWTLAVLRPELVQRYTKSEIDKWLKSRHGGDGEEGKTEEKESDPAKEKDGDAEKPAGSTDANKPEGEKKEGEDAKKDDSRSQKQLTEEEIEYIKTFRMNVNVFLPDVSSLEGIDSDATEQLKADEEKARAAALMLWEQVLPRITYEIRETAGPHHQVPADGKSLTEMLHQHGVNCRYLGRLAMLAQQEEAKDRAIDAELKKGNIRRLNRRTMPTYWLEILEMEMVARAAKHVLETYLTENGGSAAAQPSQTIASFLSALVSESEETAAQTETRMGKSNGPDEDDFNALTLCDTGAEGDAMPASMRSRTEVWSDIEKEVGRRFRYTLTLYNPAGKESRALYVPLLRRICQRTGVRLVAKTYDVGGKCLCSGGNTSGGRLTASFPVAPTDILDIVPLMKHAAAHVEGFVACNMGQSVGIPSLHISLPDARSTLEAAHLHCSARSLSTALDLAQEAASLYQRVTDTAAHPGVVRCMDLMATILFEAGEPGLAANSMVKSLGLQVQVAGFDSSDAMNTHLTLFQMLLADGQGERAVKHLRAAMYLMEVLSGPRYVEHSNVYHRLGTIYHNTGDEVMAMRCFQEAGNRPISDRLQEAMILRSTAMMLAQMGHLKNAVDTEKRAYQSFLLMFGEEHALTQASDASLKNFMKAAVDQGNKRVETDLKRKEEEAAALMAEQIEAEAEAEEKKKKKNLKKKKQGGKK